MSKKRRLNENMNRKSIILIKALVITAACLVALFIIARFFVMVTKVDGMSMYPTLEDGEYILVDKNYYNKNLPQRFDIVVFATPISETGQYIKRIIGLPGETVRIDNDGVIYINEEVLEEDFGAEQILDPGRARISVTLGEDEYFLMGDNRNHSEDSRFMLVGNVKKDRFLGRVSIRLWPLAKYGYIDLYTERTNTHDK